MKNQRLTNDDIVKLNMAVERIRELASLERAHFSIDDEKDAIIKKEVRSYLMWFEVVATGIEEILKGNEPGYSLFW